MGHPERLFRYNEGGQCAEALMNGSDDIVACADCRIADHSFVLPLKPEIYTLSFWRTQDTDQIRRNGNGFS